MAPLIVAALAVVGAALLVALPALLFQRGALLILDHRRRRKDPDP